MTAHRPDLRQLLLTALQPAIHQAQLGPSDLDDSFNLIESGLLDSVAFLNLIASLEAQAGRQLPLFDVDPNLLTSIGGLMKLLKEIFDESSPSSGACDG